MPELTVVLVEDSVTIRRQILQRLRSVQGLRVVGEAPDETLALALVTATQPDAVLLDLSLAGGGSGLQVLKQLRRQGYAGQVHVLSHQTPEAYRAACVAAGANGFFDKAEELDELLRALGGGAVPPPALPLGRQEFVVRLDQTALLAQRDGGDLTLQVWRGSGDAGASAELARALQQAAEPGDLVGAWEDAGEQVVAWAVPEAESALPDGAAGGLGAGAPVGLAAGTIAGLADGWEAGSGWRRRTARLPQDGFSGEALLARALLRI
ncbi:response regulator [Roseateles depolymerans]|uniref:Chemotaxis protein CheY n=1 Tax=Roseateles depolymerans TaxID=76731 RepID=A0A0U3CA67_9BURK|nr:response regulator transcription factor [Roseateles depolymerans]ALV05672.1 chemotaxis protein CheY [Roseateles depolymerans]REG13058.1 DNA-binding NarL/FixJ family response regulator [Roseateles depolymerans]